MKKELLASSLIIILFLTGCSKNEVNTLDNINENKEVVEDVNQHIEVASKIDSNKDWVYAAEYEKNIEAESYTTEFEETYYASDIVVPYININSDDAKSANEEIKMVFDDAIKIFNEGTNDGLSYVDECNYESYVDDNILSVLITYGTGATSVVHPSYYAYNFDLKTGNKLTYEDVYQIAGFSTAEIESKVEEAIINKMKEMLADFSEDALNDVISFYEPENTSDISGFEFLKNRGVNEYKNSVNTNSLRYFLSTDGKLNIIVTLSIPADTGEFDTIITIE